MIDVFGESEIDPMESFLMLLKYNVVPQEDNSGQSDQVDLKCHVKSLLISRNELSIKQLLAEAAID